MANPAFTAPAPSAFGSRLRRALPRPIQLDILERIFLGFLYGWFVAGNFSVYLHSFDIRALLMVVSETLPILLISLRKPSETMSPRPMDWVVGLAGGALPLLVTANGAVRPLVPLFVCFMLISIGLFIQIAAKVALGKSFGVIAANRGVKTSGPYRFVRHPMYVGYTITHIGIMLSMPSLRNVLFYSFAFSFQVLRVLREERVLRDDPQYRAFAEQVRWRLIPDVF